MKICVISNLYKPYTRGGAEKIVDLTVQEFKKNHSVVVITTQPQKSSVENNEGLTIYRFRPVNIFYYLNDFKHSVLIRLLWHFIDIFNVFSAIKIKEILQKEKPDLVITHNLKGLGYLIPRIIKKLKIKHFHVLHDVQYAIPSGLIFKNKETDFVVAGFLTKFYQKICRKLIIADQIISPSKWLLDFYKDKGYFHNCQTKILRNPVEIVKNSIEIIEKKQYNKFLFLGQIEPHKGVEFMIEALGSLSDITVFIAGKGTELEKLQKKYYHLGNVKFLGHLSHDEIITYFNQCDYLIMPTLCYENSPTVIYESFMYTKPVIVANIGGAAELVQDSGAGYVFEAGDKDELINVVKKAIVNEQYLQMSASATKYIEQFDVANYVKVLLKI